ncbi:MAG: hypothetical protein GEU92_05915 [Alphaproteobacteria bacterium]|nr:hypothetical protein [Alphaproteobacteria bacterium]
MSGKFAEMLLNRCSDWKLVRDRIDCEQAFLAQRPDLAPPLIAQQLLISGEDHRNGKHPGFDSVAIGRAIWRRIAYGKREGASTIEQQLVRTVTGRYERSIRRKAKEIILAALVSAYYPKYILPSIYLSIAYYGWRMNGYQQACRRLHFTPNSLQFAEAASLVARLKYPEPKSAPSIRTLQIQRRSEHLMTLYKSHLRHGIYEHLNDTPLLRGCPVSIPRLSVPKA